MNHFEALDILRDQEWKSVGDIEKAYALIFDGITRYVPHHKKNLALKNEIRDKFGTLTEFAYEIGVHYAYLSDYLNGKDDVSGQLKKQIRFRLNEIREDHMILPIPMEKEKEREFIKRFVLDQEVIKHVSLNYNRIELGEMIWMMKREL